MKPRELVQIINACGRNGVRHLKFGDIELEFSYHQINRKNTSPSTKKSVQNQKVNELESDNSEVESIEEEIVPDMFDDFESYEDHMLTKA